MKRRGDDCAFLDMTHLPKGVPPRALPAHLRRPARSSASTWRCSPSRWCRRPTTSAAAWSPTSTGAPASPASSPSARWPAPGLHGANRLASNSLLEGLVFGRRAALRRAPSCSADERPAPPSARTGTRATRSTPDEGVVVTHNWDEVRRLMWNYVGIVRTEKRLERARTRLRILRARDPRVLLGVPGDARPGGAAQPRRRGACSSCECARRRKESRGLHYLLDYPKPRRPLAARTRSCTAATSSEP